MAFDDQPLHHTISSSSEGQPEPPPARPSVLRWILVGLAGVAAGALLTFWWMSRAQPTTSAPPSPTAHDVAIGSNRPEAATDRSAVAQRLRSADPATGRALSKSPWLARFLATPGLLRAGALAIVQIGDGRTPADPAARAAADHPAADRRQRRGSHRSAELRAMERRGHRRHLDRSGRRRPALRQRQAPHRRGLHRSRPLGRGLRLGHRPRHRDASRYAGAGGRAHAAQATGLLRVSTIPRCGRSGPCRSSSC